MIADSSAAVAGGLSGANSSTSNATGGGKQVQSWLDVCLAGARARGGGSYQLTSEVVLF